MQSTVSKYLKSSNLDEISRIEELPKDIKSPKTFEKL